jgi:hypothetical protein
VTSTATSATVGIAAYGPDRTAVAGTVDRVLAASSAKARQMQDRAGAPAAGRLDTFVTLPTQTTELAPASKLKLVLAILAVGVIAGAGLSLLLDRILAKWRPRRAKTAVPRRARRKTAPEDAADEYEPDRDEPARPEPTVDEPFSEFARAGQASVGAEETG